MQRTNLAPAYIHQRHEWWIYAAAMGITEPTVRAGERLRRNRRRLPPGVPTITVRIDDHRSGTMYASFASPDGKQWASYGYWPAQEARSA